MYLLRGSLPRNPGGGDGGGFIFDHTIKRLKTTNRMHFLQQNREILFTFYSVITNTIFDDLHDLNNGIIVKTYTLSDFE